MDLELETCPLSHCYISILTLKQVCMPVMLQLELGTIFKEESRGICRPNIPL